MISLSVWCLLVTTCLHCTSPVTCQIQPHRPTDMHKLRRIENRDIDRYICDVWQVTCDVIWCVSYFIWDQFDQKIWGSCRPVIFQPDKISPIAGSTLLYSKCCFSRFLFFINCVVSQETPGAYVRVVCYTHKIRQEHHKNVLALTERWKKGVGVNWSFQDLDEFLFGQEQH